MTDTANIIVMITLVLHYITDVVLVGSMGSLYLYSSLFISQTQ